MAPAPDLCSGSVLEEDVVAGVGVRVDLALEVLEDPLGMLLLPEQR
jgi:hypothetical protein